MRFSADLLTDFHVDIVFFVFNQLELTTSINFRMLILP